MANGPFYNGLVQTYATQARPSVPRPSDAFSIPPFSVSIIGESSVSITLTGPIRFSLGISGESSVSIKFYHTPGPTITAIADPIAAALAGMNGPVVLSCRIEQRDLNYNFYADITNAVIACPVALDNDRPVTRTATFTLDATQLPNGFQASLQSKQCVSVTVLVLVAGVYLAFPFGVFFFDYPEIAQTPNGAGQWQVPASDLSLALANQNTQNTYTVPSGSNYITAITNILASFGLRYNLPTVASTLPVDATWAAQTAYIQIVNDLLLGINYYPIHVDELGVFRTRGLRTDPSQVQSAVTYSTVAEPMMVRGDTPFKPHIDLSNYANVCMVAIDDPLRSAVSSTHTNADPASPISTVAAAKTTRKEIKGGTSPTSKCVLDGPTAGQIAAYELQEGAARAQTATFATLIDPRRTNREWYTLNIDDYEHGTLWRAGKWSANLDPLMQNPLMTHEVGRAKVVVIS